jgi:hypothetical protein
MYTDSGEFFSKAARAFGKVAVQQSQRLKREWYPPLKTVELSVLPVLRSAQ